jgi:hypothetical protein
VISKFL